MNNPNNRQVAGNHYTKSEYQHWDFITENGLCYLVGCATKYIARWRKKGQPLDDLQKAIHYTEKLVYEMEENDFQPSFDANVSDSHVDKFAAANGLDNAEVSIIKDLVVCAFSGHLFARAALGKLQALYKDASKMGTYKLPSRPKQEGTTHGAD